MIPMYGDCDLDWDDIATTSARGAIGGGAASASTSAPDDPGDMFLESCAELLGSISVDVDVFADGSEAPEDEASSEGFSDMG